MPASPAILPEDLTDKTEAEIRALARRLHLKVDGARAGRFLDPVGGRERLRIDGGHPDALTGEPYRNPKVAVAHVHAYPQAGPRAGKVLDLEDGDPHFVLRRESGDGFGGASDWAGPG